MLTGDRRTVIVITSLLCVVLVSFAFAGTEEKVGKTSSTELVKRGAEIGDSPTVKLSDVLTDPDRFTGKPVVFEAVVGDVCQKKGCWMTVGVDDKIYPVRMTFKDYGFFVPMDAGGMVARAEGEFHIKVWSKEDADHLEGDGAEIVRNADGTATEIGFVASGVELRKAAATRMKESSKPSSVKSDTDD